MTRSAVAVDLEKHLLQTMQDDLNRRLQIMAEVLDPPELALILFNIGCGLCLGGQAFAACHALPDTDVREMLDEMIAVLERRLRKNRDLVLSTAEALKRGEQPRGAL